MTSMPHGAGRDVEGTMMEMGMVVHVQSITFPRLVAALPVLLGGREERPSRWAGLWGFEG